MAKVPYLEEDYCMKHYNSKDETHISKSLSFFASMFSILIFIFVLYIFKLSPFTLFNNNIFWFFMSNILILIAADYGAFSSSKKKMDLHEEYVLHSQQRNYGIPSYVPQYEQVDKQCIAIDGKSLREKKETIVNGSLLKCVTVSREINLLPTRREDTKENKDKNSEIIPECVLEIAARDELEKASEWSNYKKPILPLYVGDGYKKFEEKATHVRIRSSKSNRYHRDKVKSVLVDEREKRMMRLETMKVEEENEFSNMTNEDLNRRVEEFIQKFNRQIRLQATTHDNQM